MTNPLDVAQNEMYKTGDSFLAVLRHLLCRFENSLNIFACCCAPAL